MSHEEFLAGVREVTLHYMVEVSRSAIPEKMRDVKLTGFNRTFDELRQDLQSSSLLLDQLIVGAVAQVITMFVVNILSEEAK